MKEANLKKRKGADLQRNLYTSSTNTNNLKMGMITQDMQEIGTVSLVMSIIASDRMTRLIKIL